VELPLGLRLKGSGGGASTALKKLADAASSIAERTKSGQDRSSHVAKLQVELAVHVVRTVGKPGSSVLVFVSGMGEIVELSDRFEALNEGAGSGGVTYKEKGGGGWSWVGGWVVSLERRL